MNDELGIRRAGLSLRTLPESSSQLSAFSLSAFSSRASGISPDRDGRL
jgi:hypothetical protein